MLKSARCKGSRLLSLANNNFSRSGEWLWVPLSVNNLSRFLSSNTLSKPRQLGDEDGRPLGVSSLVWSSGEVFVPLSDNVGVLGIEQGLGDRCKALLPILGDLVLVGDLFTYWHGPVGEEGDGVVGDLGGKCLRTEGDKGGVLLSFGEGGLGGLFFKGCLGIRVFGPEESLGVGGSPLLQAMEQ